MFVFADLGTAIKVSVTKLLKGRNIQLIGTRVFNNSIYLIQGPLDQKLPSYWNRKHSSINHEMVAIKF